MKARAFAFWCVVSILAETRCAAVILDQLIPISGPSGTIVTLSGQEFAADAEASPDGTGGLPRGRLVTVLNTGSGMNEVYFELSFICRQAPVDLIYRVEYSDDLVSWQDALGGTPFLASPDVVPVNPPGNVERATYRSADPVSNALAGKYLRVKISESP